MKAPIVCACLASLVVSQPVSAEEVLARFDLSDQTAKGEQQVEGPNGPPATQTVLTIENPGIDSSLYALRGQIRHQGVEGQAYLEMWSQFPGKQRYFSRTLAGAGPMSGVSGDSAWRAIVVPFANEPGGPPPERIELNVVLPAAGQVWLGSFELVQFAPGEDPLAAASNAWFDPTTGGLVGGLVGSALGLLGGLIGLLLWLGRSRGLAMGLLVGMLLVGVAALGVGLAAVLSGQPYAVFYPFLLLGGLGLVLAGLGLAVGRRRYQSLELARMQARDMPA